MKKQRQPVTQLLTHVLNPVQKTFVRSRPGSVLILVIALLVLMALIGTAYMSMAQADRQTSVQHENNTEIDMLMDGLANMLRGSIVAELYNQGNFRPGQQYNTVSTPSTYQNLTGVGLDPTTVAPTTTNPGSTYLAARLPELMGEVGTNNGTVTALNQPSWSFITAPLIGGQFSSPLPANGNLNTNAFLDGQVAGFLNYYTQRANFRGRSRYLVPGAYVAPGYPVVPAWVDPTNAANFVAAADTDGDGIADAGFIKLPIGSINGVTYYAAFRIVDGNSAINVNTAWQHNPQRSVADSINGGTANVSSMPGDFFPTSIDLSAIATGADAGIPAVTQRHFYLGSTAPPNPTQMQNAMDDNGNARSDLPSSSFGTTLEAEWMQLGRRINNPGRTGTGTNLFQAYTRNDLVGLVHSFVVRDPTLAQSQLESDLFNSLYSTVATSRFDPSLTANWYFGNFSFLANEFTAAVPPPGSNPNPLPLRSLLTTENAVSNYAPNTLNDKKLYVAGTTYAFGDGVLGPDGHRYVCIDPTQANAPVPLGVNPGPYALPPNPVPNPAPPGVAQSRESLYDNDTWVQMPWVDAPTKISVNTGTFGQLWLAYWSVMAEQQNSGGSILTNAPFELLTPLAPRMFRSPLRTPPPLTTPATPALPAFRLMPSQVMQLRAALAAVNTIDMRDNDDDVTSRKVKLVATELGAPFQTVIATVYGQEMQPYITEVYATNAVQTPAIGYVAIKLFNPYNVPLDLSNYRLGSIVRPSTPATGLADFDRTIVEIPPDAATFWNPGTAPVIPPNGFIIIASQPGPYGTGAQITVPASLKPIITAGDLPLAAGQYAEYIMSQLPTALDREIVLMRPRRGNNAVYGAAAGYTAANGTTATGAPHDPAGNYSEIIGSAAHLSDMVPVDSYDLSGLVPVATDPPVEWHYLRPSDAESTSLDQQTSWHWVYPGHYRFSTVTTPNPYPNEDVTGSLSLPPRLVDGTHRGLFPGGSFNPNTGVTKVLSVPAGVTTAGPLELWTLGQYFNPSAYVNNFYRDIPLRLNSPDMAGPNNTLHQSRISGSPGRQNNAFPYGGFARNGDILGVPFIGSYKLQTIPQDGTDLFMEMNPATMDSMMALSVSQMNWNETQTDTETTSGNCDPLVRLAVLGQPIVTYESVGRFCPITQLVGEASVATNSSVLIDDLGTNQSLWRYHFGTRLLDFLTVQSPQQDYFPDVDPAPVDTTVSGTQNPLLPYKYPLTSSTLVPLPVANSNKNTPNGEEANIVGPTEQNVGVHGLVNVNTAPWRVLAAVPWLPPQAAANNDNGQRSLNAAIAMSIVYYRDIDAGGGVPHGPFKNVFELYQVPINVVAPFTGAIAPGTLFKNVLRDSGAAAGYNDLQRGDLQANVYTGPLATNVQYNDLTQGDFVSQNLMMTRVSNLITTRSDQFVAYILLQGWTNAETPQAQMVVQRRAAYLIDRNSVVGNTNSSPSMTYVPNN